VSKKNLLWGQDKAKITPVEIRFNKIHPHAKPPAKQKAWDAGYDLHACETMSIGPMERKVIPIGLSIEIPSGYYGRIAPRSGLAASKGIDVLGGVVDSGYRGEVKVVLINLNLPESLFDKSKSRHTYDSLFGSKHRVDISEGDRIAQLIIEKCHHVTWLQQEETLHPSDRLSDGFGSTGT
tara:strand:- start:955 stop:1494 length:540 start_codon:yes stop_codon:yes gene_type:complete